MPDRNLLLGVGRCALLATIALQPGNPTGTAAASSGGAGTRMGPARGGCTVLTWDNFAENFFASNCTRCHGSTVVGADRNFAPVGLDWDVPAIVLANLNRIRVRAVEQQTMPPSPPFPSDQDRQMLGEWIDCGAPGLCADANDCDDGLFCNGAETCDAGAICQAGTPVNCGDGVGCTDDACNETTDSCDNVANDANCPDDGVYCNGTASCNATLDCVASGDPCAALGLVCDEVNDVCDCDDDADCDDGVVCTDDTCVGGSCVSTPNHANCPDDGVYCNGTASCNATLGCVSSGDPCADSSLVCDELNQICASCLADAECSNGAFCDGAESCVDGSCEGGTDPCPGKSCDEDQDECFEPDCATDGDCDDDEVCTSDACQDGRCLNTAIEGCTDDDQDRVPDRDDKCPGTTPAGVVDDVGCACDQLDGDSDGVDDCSDECTDTALDAEVDAIGCSISPPPDPEPPADDDEDDGVGDDDDDADPPTDPGDEDLPDPPVDEPDAPPGGLDDDEEEEPAGQPAPGDDAVPDDSSGDDDGNAEVTGGRAGRRPAASGCGPLGAIIVIVTPLAGLALLRPKQRRWR